MFFSKIRLREDISSRDALSLTKGNGYNVHRLVWDFFADIPERRRDFLYRHEMIDGAPTFYVVSERQPADATGMWELLAKEYRPKLVAGQPLSFTLRVNPICAKRDASGRQHRHDVVMETKSRIGFKKLPHDKRPHMASLIQEAGVTWLKDREKNYGFFMEDNKEKPPVRADGYIQHKLYNGKGGKLISFSTLDFKGVLVVTDPEKFIEESLYKGIGPAKGFGCGLMLVRRI